MPRRITAVGSAAIALAIVPASTGWADVEVRTDLRPGALVREHGVGVVVPGPGQFVTSEALSEDGARMITAHTRQDGTVLVSTAGGAADDDMTVMEPPLGRAIPACDDPARTFMAWSWSHGKPVRWRSNFRWWFRSSTTPTYMNVDYARAAISRAVQNIVSADNDCGWLDTVDATSDFGGDTTQFATNMATDGLCVTPDGVSVVAFGTLPAGTYAGTCVWGIDEGDAYGRITSSDVRVNKASYTWYAVKPSDCQTRNSVEAVLTHEFGHTFGLGHVGPEDTHGWLTMSTQFNGPCQSSESTLGLGDLNGLFELY
ncbi:MAG TPA: hypothetical protein VGW75_07950 [Solirubrobacteraceae bacterium]|jgi:hypothetical protein|nr:hypothetical protein [Solirubrobacteraceae bacterium]